MATLDKKPRLKLAMRRRPYFSEIRKGLALGYRRNQGPGTWIVRGADGKGKNWMKAFATADDVDAANGDTIMTYDQARERAITLARGNVPSSADGKRPITVEGALDVYQTDLLARGQSKQNATSVRYHLKDTAIFKTAVASLEKGQLTAIRNAMVTTGGMKPASADRIGKSLKAALNLAASNDPRIINVKAWSEGWKLLPNTTTARNIILETAVVRAIVLAAYKADGQLGIQLDILAETGTRESQMLGLRVSDLQGNRPDPRLMMPSSRKGRNRQQRHIPVPISARLAHVLRVAVAGRAAGDPIVHEITRLSDRFREVADVVGGVPDKVVPYSFRHSSIVRQLRGFVPIRIVASLHDTSVVIIERHYSAYITDDDTLARATLPDLAA